MVRECTRQSGAEAAVTGGIESEGCDTACARLLTQTVYAAGVVLALMWVYVWVHSRLEAAVSSKCCCLHFKLKPATPCSDWGLRLDIGRKRTNFTRSMYAGLDLDTQACLDDAFRTLEELQDESHDAPKECAVQRGAPGQASKPTVLDGSKEELQRRLLQSASIMRKLYTRNTALESKLALIQTSQASSTGQSNQSSSASIEVDTTRDEGCVLSSPTSISPLRPSTCPSKGQGMTQISLLHQKDAVIGQLKEALNSSQRQVHLLRSALEHKDAPARNNARPSSRPSSRNSRLGTHQIDSSCGFLRSGVWSCLILDSLRCVVLVDSGCVHVDCTYCTFNDI